MMTTMMPRLVLGLTKQHYDHSASANGTVQKAVTQLIPKMTFWILYKKRLEWMLNGQLQKAKCISSLVSLAVIPSRCLAIQRNITIPSEGSAIDSGGRGHAVKNIFCLLYTSQSPRD